MGGWVGGEGGGEGRGGRGRGRGRWPSVQDLLEARQRPAHTGPEVVGGPGIDVQLVCDGSVPVVSSLSSAYSTHAAWLLQTLMHAPGKAKELYDPIEDERIIRDCASLGYLRQDCRVFRLRGEQPLTAVGVGSSGKRSATMALVVALFMHGDLFEDETRGGAQNPSMIEFVREVRPKQAARRAPG